MLELKTDEYFHHTPLILDKYLTTKLHDWPIESDLYSRGYSSLVYEGTNKKFIIKLMFINVPVPEEYCKNRLTKCWKKNYKQFRMEVNIAKKLDKLGIGPEVYGAFEGTATCEFYQNKGYSKVQVGLIIYEKFDTTLKQFISPKTSVIDRTRIFTFLTYAFQKFNDMLIEAYDTHEKNVMVQLKNNTIKKIAIIDFGEFTITTNTKNKNQIIENNSEVFAKLEKYINLAYQRN